jgi:hypothetical protein
MSDKPLTMHPFESAIVRTLEADNARLTAENYLLAHDRDGCAAENEKLRAALVRWLDAVNDKRALEHHQPDNLGKEWVRLREAVDLAEDNARAELSGDKHDS